ncbi:YTH domain-containing protein [Artemisia annua]|uniref:YTH domain-containing family protein n=1 Tax=Artemisia annua TaxID=35608 RepID=A0A2U1LZU1_ARTAN|nr:YTH domain-containing protein [Artemisia annua]
MAAVVPSADQAADLLKNLSIDSQAKTLEVPEPTKKTSVNNVNGQVQSGNKTGAPLVSDYVDPSLAYYPNGYPYFYGYDGTTTDWDEYSRYMSSDDLAHGVYGYGYAPYAPYSPAGSPVPTVGQDGQYYGGQQYQYPTPFFTPLTPTGNGYPAAAPAKGDATAPAAADKPILAVDTAKGNTNGVGAKGNTVPGPLKPATYQYNANGSYGSGGLSSYQDPRFGYGGVTSPVSWMDNSMYTNPQRRNNTNSVPVSYGKGVASKTPTNLMNQRPLTGVNTTSGYMNRLYPNNLYGQYGSTYRSGYGYGATAYDMQNNGRGWMTVDNKYKPRGRGNGFFGYNNENSDGLNELNRGPRSRITKNPKVFTPIAIAVKGQEIALAPTESVEKDVKEVAVKEVTVTPDREQYNKTDFSETYADAKFFIIKSYSEDDVHKSIKYNVWASTQNGNKKLEAAYQEAQQKPEGCPIFLFFSVNTSGQFVGVAEMVGPVDFNKSLEYWQQDKWIGCFPVKWHIVKDLPNSLLKHIILENNENKPVTNSRDTQEVKLDQGLQVIKIFKEHSSKQCILDDFEFYEDRQKKIQEKKAKQQQFQKQAWEGKPAIDEKIKEGIKADAAKSVDVVTALVNEVKLVNNVQNDVANGVGDVAKPLEEKVVANGIANGC